MIIIDDIGPLIATQSQEQQANLEQFRKLLHSGLATIAPVLDEFARVIADFCHGQHEALVLELAEIQNSASAGSATSDVKGERRAAQVRTITW